MVYIALLAAFLPLHLLSVSHCSVCALLRTLRHLPLAMALRDGTKYNNLMYGVAGRVIEVLSGSHWEHVTTERILDPLDMTDT